MSDPITTPVHLTEAEIVQLVGATVTSRFLVHGEPEPLKTARRKLIEAKNALRQSSPTL